MTRESNIVYRSVFVLDNEEGYRMIRLLKEIYKTIPSAYLKETNRFDPVISLLKDKRKYNVGLDCTLMTDSKQFDTMTVEEGYKGDLPCFVLRFFLIDSKISAKDLIIVVGRTNSDCFKYFVEAEIFRINDYLSTRYIPKNDETVWTKFFKDLIFDYTLNSNGLCIKFCNVTFFIKNPIVKFCLYEIQEKYTYKY